MSVKYSIIIPTLNEEYFLKKNLEKLKSFGRDFQIIISDGGSKDNTSDVALRNNSIVVNSNPGRGIQLNAGVSVASGDILIFLHADTFLPGNAIDLIERTFSEDKVQVARFKLGFDFSSKLLDFYKQFSIFDSQFTRFGDSAIIVRKEFFFELNGFSERETFEDVDFFKKASKKTKIILIDENVSSSARRFISDGVIKRQFYNIFLFIAYLFGVDQKFLNKMYSYPKTKKKNALIIFLRYPKTGEVKTRLAKTTSSEFAVKFYKTCSEKIITDVKKLNSINRFVFFSNKEENIQVKKWLGGKLFYSPQEGDNLGSRMENAFEKVFSSGAEKAVIIGTDVPDLSKNIIEEAFKTLDDNDIVIGPSKDGGYYLLGMKKIYPELFNGIEFSTNTVFNETINQIEKLNLSFCTLPELQDIDTEDDLINWLNGKHANTIKNNIRIIYESI